MPSYRIPEKEYEMRTHYNGITIEQRANELAQGHVENAATILSQEYDLKIQNAERYILHAQSVNPNRPATRKQLDYIVALGYEPREYMTVAQASEMISAIKSGEADSLGYARPEGTQFINEKY
jgi:hypothetical protein